MATRRFPRCDVVLASLCAAVLITGCSDSAGTAPAVPSSPTPTSGSPSTPAPPEVALDWDNRALLAQARRSGQPVVILLVATEVDRTAEAIAGLEELGGIVGSGGPTAGYPVGHLRVSLPTENVERAAALPAVTTVDIELIPRNNPRPQGAPP
ncbi:MAG: hypothetical protein M3291_05080 [Actinomycetota bacterium]|nr:hypothetical protein [Actinomycetota bacterium]